ncbi:MAG: glycosyltransferase [Chloroflexi bacterium]|nr:glycosyltransferase [Chloroflexota bacterium]
MVVDTSVADDLCDRYGVDRSQIDVAPPGVGPPFDTWPLDDIDRRSGRYFVFVGGHDKRKNLRFLLELWPSIHRTTGLELYVTRRAASSVSFEDQVGHVRGVVVRVEPDDRVLAALYANAIGLLWPSIYEGYGLPLLEAMAVGTPFISTDTGAARNLALVAEQILPLDADRWRAQICDWAKHGVGRLRVQSAAQARERTWEETAALTAASLKSVAADVR